MKSEHLALHRISLATSACPDYTIFISETRIYKIRSTSLQVDTNTNCTHIGIIANDIPRHYDSIKIYIFVTYSSKNHDSKYSVLFIKLTLNCIDFAYNFKLHFFPLWKCDINFTFKLVFLISQSVENIMDKKQIFQQFFYSWILFNRNNKSALIAIGLYFRLIKFCLRYVHLNLTVKNREKFLSNLIYIYKRRRKISLTTD